MIWQWHLTHRYPNTGRKGKLFLPNTCQILVLAPLRHHRPPRNLGTAQPYPLYAVCSFSGLPLLIIYASSPTSRYLVLREVPYMLVEMTVPFSCKKHSTTVEGVDNKAYRARYSLFNLLISGSSTAVPWFPVAPGETSGNLDGL